MMPSGRCHRVYSTQRIGTEATGINTTAPSTVTRTPTRRTSTDVDTNGVHTLTPLGRPYRPDRPRPAGPTGRSLSGQRRLQTGPGARGHRMTVR